MLPETEKPSKVYKRSNDGCDDMFNFCAGQHVGGQENDLFLWPQHGLWMMLGKTTALKLDSSMMMRHNSSSSSTGKEIQEAGMCRSEKYLEVEGEVMMIIFLHFTT